MKPYRGMHLAAAVLLAALPFAGCGDADKFQESGAITLTSDVSSIEAKSQEVVFTVVSVPTTTTPAPTANVKAIVDECQMDLEYRSDGAGVNQNWSDIPGTGPTRVFRLAPRQIGTLNVLARGKCVESHEEWQYSAQVKVAVVDKVLPEVKEVTLAANPTSVAVNKSVTFTLGATVTDPTNENKCTLNLSYQYSGGGFGVTTVYPAYIGQFILTPTAVGKLTVTAHGWCSENPSNATETTTVVDVTAVALPKVTSVTLTASSNPYTVAPAGLNITLSATADAGCTVKFSTLWSGGGISGSNPSAVAGTFNVKPNVPASSPLLVDASAWCAENSTAIVSASQLSVVIQ